MSPHSGGKNLYGQRPPAGAAAQRAVSGPGQSNTLNYKASRLIRDAYSINSGQIAQNRNNLIVHIADFARSKLAQGDFVLKLPWRRYHDGGGTEAAKQN